MVLSETHGLMAFFDCPRGHRVESETRVFFKHGPDFSDCYFPSKSSVSRARWPPPRNGSQGWNRLFARGAQAACGFRQLASKRTSFFHTISVIAAIFLAKVRRAIVGFLPLASKAS
jgi:hypothetical protein